VALRREDRFGNVWTFQTDPLPTGPIDNMKLSYTSDPPLQFQEIVSLLAAGTTPTSDLTLLANRPQAPPQGFQQRGESLVLGQAVTNPVASRLQRVFGVSQLRIDPSFNTSAAATRDRNDIFSVNFFHRRGFR